MVLIFKFCEVITQRVKDLVARRSVIADRIHRNAVFFFIALCLSDTFSNSISNKALINL